MNGSSEKFPTTPALFSESKSEYDPDSILTIALDICEGMLESGAETHRVEDTAERICRAYGAHRVEIFAITSLVVATIALPNGEDCTQVRRVYGNVNDLFKIEKLNALSRTICRDKPCPDEVKEEIFDIMHRSGNRCRWLKYVGGFLGAFGFTMFFGGTVFDALIAALVGLLICGLDMNRPKYLNQIAYTAIVSAIGSLLIAMIYRFLGQLLPMHSAEINIGVIMLLIPGLALGNAVRDLLCGEVVSGAVKFLQCILVAGAIAAGFTSILLVFGGDSASASGISSRPLLMILTAGIGTIGFSLLFSVPPKRLFYAVLGGMLSCSCYLAAGQISPDDLGFSPVLLASISGGVACTCYAEVMARINKTPTTVFLIPAMIPLVPGGALYYTMAYLVQHDNDMAVSKGLDTLYTCMGISIGIVLVSVLFQIIWNLHLKVSKKRNERNSRKKLKEDIQRR